MAAMICLDPGSGLAIRLLLGGQMVIEAAPTLSPWTLSPWPSKLISGLA